MADRPSVILNLPGENLEAGGFESGRGAAKMSGADLPPGAGTEFST